MNTAYFDSKADDDTRRQRLFQGQIFVFSPRRSTLALAAFAKELIEEAFGSIDPLEAQYYMPVERYVEIVAPLKPQFIHHPRTKGLIKDVLLDLGCDPETTYQDVPRLRMVTSDGYLTSGVGYAHDAHRDTWYSAPMCQLNWWLPIYEIESDRSMAFHPRYWSDGVENGSSDFNYYEWNSTGRKNAAKQIKQDTRKQPKPLLPIEAQPEIRFIPPAGGIVLFSGAQMHSTVPNTSGVSRYSMDFRTVNINDVIAHDGAPNVDSSPTGTSLRDFVRMSDGQRIDERIVATYDSVPPPEDLVLVFEPKDHP